MEQSAVLKAGSTRAVFSTSLYADFNAPASKPYLVTIEPLDHDKELSIQEHKTMRMWCSEWGKQQGMGAEECYCEFKFRFLFPTIAHKKKHAGIKQLIKDVYRSVNPEIRYYAAGSYIRSEWANHDEYHQAITEFEIWARTSAGLVLTDPDKYRVARDAAIASGVITEVK